MVAKRSTWIAGSMLTIYLLTLALQIPRWPCPSRLPLGSSHRSCRMPPVTTTSSHQPILSGPLLLSPFTSHQEISMSYYSP